MIAVSIAERHSTKDEIYLKDLQDLVRLRTGGLKEYVMLLWISK